MLIEVRAPRLKPAGGPVMRVRRDHALATELVGCFLFGGAAGVGVDLVTGIVATAGGAPVPTIGPDGPGLDTGSSSHYASFAHDASHNTLAHMSLAWRGLRNSTTDDVIVSKLNWGAGGGGEYTPWDFQIIPGGNISFVRSRRGVFQFRAWQGSASFVPTSSMVSLSISQGDAIEVAPRFFVNGVEDSTPTNMYGGGAAGNAYGNTDPVIFNGYKGTSNNADAHHSLFLLAATMWDTSQHLAFDADPYGILEDAPLYHFLGSNGSLPLLTAGSDLTLAPITGSATAAVAVAGTSSAALPALSAATAATVALAGTSASTLAAPAAVTSGAVAVAGQSVVTLAAMAGTTSAAVASAAGSAVALAEISATMAGTLALAGTSAAALVITGAMIGTVALAASSVLELGAITGTMLALNPYVVSLPPGERSYTVTLPARAYTVALAARAYTVTLPPRSYT